MNRLLITILLSAITTLATQAQQHKLWYSQPASHWLEALPVGNSHLGAMVYGKTDTEEIQLNEETFWSGSPHNNNSPEAKAHLQEVRQISVLVSGDVAHHIARGILLIVSPIIINHSHSVRIIAILKITLQ